MSAHTPGPWHDDGYRIYAPSDHIDKRNGRVIVEYKHTADFNMADARLIAAAPDLLAACELALGAFERNDAIDWSELEYAIAKAEGK